MNSGCDKTQYNDRRLCVQISYCCVLRAVGRSAGTQPDQKMRIRQLVSSTILIFLVCFSPYHIFLLVRTLLERDCSFITGTLHAKRFRWSKERQREREPCSVNHLVCDLALPGIFNYYHLSLLLTTLNCLADPALYCFVSESARHSLLAVVSKPVARIVCCCRRQGNSIPSNPVTDSHEVATEENNGHLAVMLLSHSGTVKDVGEDTSRKHTVVIAQTDERTVVPLTVQQRTQSSAV